MEGEPHEPAVSHETRVAEQDRLAQNDGDDGNVHGIAHVAIEAGNDEVLGRGDRRRRAEPCSAKRANELTSPGKPATINSIPTARVACRSKNGGRNSQREIHHGTTPASTQGTNTKKVAVPMTAAALRMDTIRSLLISNHIALMSQSGHSLPNLAVRATSAFLPSATELRTSLEVRFVPQAEVELGGCRKLGTNFECASSLFLLLTTLAAGTCEFNSTP